MIVWEKQVPDPHESTYMGSRSRTSAAIQINEGLIWWKKVFCDACLPYAMEYVRGIMTIVRKAGIASPVRPQGMLATFIIIRDPTTNRAGPTA